MEVAVPCRIYGLSEDVDRRGTWVFLDFKLSEDPEDMSRSEESILVSHEDAHSIRSFYGEKVELVCSDEVDVRKPKEPGNIPVKVWKAIAYPEEREGGVASLLVRVGGEPLTSDNSVSFEVPTLYLLMYFSKRISRKNVVYFRYPPPEDPKKKRRR